MESDLLKVLVLCTDNSCRSVMAEALINTLARRRYHAWSAGTVPAGYVHPKSIETLQRHGINSGHPSSKSLNDVAWQSFDLIITVCDQAAGESCPWFPGTPKKLHWSIRDPAKVIAIPLARIGPFVLGAGGKHEDRHSRIVIEVDHPRAAAFAATLQDVRQTEGARVSASRRG
jgi:arsenate reductase